MKKDNLKIALCLIVKGTDEEAKLLNRCLETMRHYVDGLYVTCTQESLAVRKVVAKYKGNYSYFEWCDDFAAARNFNFKQVPKDYTHIMWSDADDMWRGMEKLRPTLKDHPHTDAFGFWYLYDWDEFKKPVVVHRKTMIIRNDGCANWVGRLHEDLEPTRQLDVFLVEGIERLHISTPERYVKNADRNVKIAALEVESNPDDPRSYWNLGNAQFGVADYVNAKDAFDKFMEVSQSDEEKYLVHQRLADIYKSSEKRDLAIKELQHAIGLQPTLPDAYYQLAHLLYGFNQLEKAEHYCIQGMLRRPKIHKMIVYNPRDYDYNPMMLLAKIYYHRSRPDLMLPLLEKCLEIYPEDEKLIQMVKEGKADKRELGKALRHVQRLQKIKSKKKLKEEIAKLPASVRSNPAIIVLRNQNFIKTESSGKDLSIYCGMTVHKWSPAGGMIGGSEEAVINNAREFAKAGWNVTVYNNCGHKQIHDVVAEGKEVLYKPFWEWNYRDKQDVTILWRWAKPLDAEINSTKIFVDVHDVVMEGEFTPTRLKKVDKIFVKSKWHRSLYPNISDDKFVVVPNGVDSSLFKGEVEKDPMLCINTSSPDRALGVLPKLWKQVREQVPEARLQWAYGWAGFENMHAHDVKKIEWKERVQAEMKRVGIEDSGRLTQQEVAELYEKASYLLYPTEFGEIDCISVRKAQIAGCMPITTDFAALAESVEVGIKVHSEKTIENWAKPYQFHFGLEDEKVQQEWVAKVVASLKERAQIGRQDSMADRFSWDNIAKEWMRHFV